MAGGETQQARLGQCLAIDLRQQLLASPVLVDELAREHMAMAAAFAQRDAPGPARLLCGGAGVRRQSPLGPFGRYGPGAVHGQPVAEVHKGHAQRFAQQHGGKARAVHEEVAGHLAAIGQLQVGHAAIGVPRHIDHLALDPTRAAPLGEATQEAGIEHGIEVVGAIKACRDCVALGIRQAEAAFAGHHCGQAVITQLATQPRLHAVVLAPQRHRAVKRPKVTEGVEVVLALDTPVHELDAELEAALRGGQHLGLVDAQQAIEGADRREGRLTNTDDAQLLGLDQFHLRTRHTGGEGGGRHPAGGSAAEDDDASRGHAHYSGSCSCGFSSRSVLAALRACLCVLR